MRRKKEMGERGRISRDAIVDERVGSRVRVRASVCVCVDERTPKRISTKYRKKNAKQTAPASPLFLFNFLPLNIKYECARRIHIQQYIYVRVNGYKLLYMCILYYIIYVCIYIYYYIRNEGRVHRSR